MQNSKIFLRNATDGDIPSICTLYSETVRSVNAKDYSPEQIEVWSSSGENHEMWRKRIKEQYFVLALINDVVAGFCSVASDGYLDFMYVHKDYQRIGVAKTLLGEIERKAIEQHNPQIFSHVSKTARGFFERYGYEHKEDLVDVYKGVTFINALMVKNLR